MYLGSREGPPRKKTVSASKLTDLELPVKPLKKNLLEFQDKLSQQELAIESLTKKPEVSMTPREAVNSNLIDELNKSEKENKWLQDKFSNVQRVNKSIQLEQAK